MNRPIWPDASSQRVDRSLSAHSVMGLVISALLFIICLSGAIAVFEDEIGWWERPETPHVSVVTPEAAQTAAEAAMASDPETTHLYLYLPRENWPRFLVGTDNGIQTANSDGTIAGEYESAWNDFLIHMHYYLHLPETFGMIIVAIFGVMLVAMALSGLLAHPRIFRDAFRLKRQGQPRISQADIHNRLSVWTAPFHIIVAASGAMIGLFVVVAYILAQTSFEGDTRALSEAVFGTEAEPDLTPAPMADIATAMTTMREIAPDAPQFLVVLHDPGTLGQHTGIYGEHTDRLIYGETYEFDANGAFTGRDHASDGELGKQLASSIYRIHFGDFGSHYIKIAYLFLGLMLCVIISGGMNIYFLKSTEKGKPRPRLEAAWSALVWGSPALLAITLLLAVLGAGSGLLTPVFWLGLIITAVISALYGQKGRAGKCLRPVTGLSLLAAVTAHFAMHAPTYANPYIWVTALALSLTGVALIGPGFARILKPSASPA